MHVTVYTGELQWGLHLLIYSFVVPERTNVPLSDRVVSGHFTLFSPIKMFLQRRKHQTLFSYGFWAASTLTHVSADRSTLSSEHMHRRKVLNRVPEMESEVLIKLWETRKNKLMWDELRQRKLCLPQHVSLPRQTSTMVLRKTTAFQVRHEFDQ